jgi:hypothetical protein
MAGLLGFAIKEALNYALGSTLQAGASQTVTIALNVNQYVTGVGTFTNTIYIIAAQSP